MPTKKAKRYFLEELRAQNSTSNFVRVNDCEKEILVTFLWSSTLSGSVRGKFWLNDLGKYNNFSWLKPKSSYLFFEGMKGALATTMAHHPGSKSESS